MPFEERQLAFSTEEVINALRQYFERNPDPDFGKGALEDATFSKEGSRCVMHCTVARDGLRMPVKATELLLTPALVQFCKTNRVPLPRRAPKELEVIEAGLALTMRLGQERVAETQKIVPSFHKSAPRTPDPNQRKAMPAPSNWDDFKAYRFRQELNQKR